MKKMYKMLLPAVAGLLLASSVLAAPGSGEKPTEKEPKVIRRLESTPPVLRTRRTRGVRSIQPDHRVKGIAFRGTVDRIGDGIIRMSQPVPDELRRMISETKQVPLTSVPKRTFRSVYLFDMALLDEVSELVGKEVDATLTLNSRGYFELSAIELASKGKRP